VIAKRMPDRQSQAGFQSGVKSAIKRMMPRPVKNLITRWRTNQIQEQYAPLSLADTFDRIYNSNAWGSNDGATPNSGVGSTGRYVEEYCVLLQKLLKTYDVGSVADLGCGNFNTGKVIAPLVAHYTGVDIAQPVIDANTRDYAGERIHFVRADLTRDPLPRADAAIVRQVLQHLTNSEIRAALDNVLRAYPLAFITEHLYTGRGSRPNLDIPHGPGTRVPMKSGVWIDLPPFSARAALAGDIEYASNEVLRTWAVTAS
jgi:SAM-dependent methyltransferase